MDNCTECGAQDSLIDDDQMGEVVCTECGTVARMGLSEKNIAWDEQYSGKGFATMTVDESAVDQSGGGGGNTAEAKSMKTALDISTKLAAGVGVPANVAEAAVSLWKRYTRQHRLAGAKIGAIEVTVAACLYLVAPSMRFPVTPNELLGADQRLDSTQLGAKAREVAAELQGHIQKVGLVQRTRDYVSRLLLALKIGLGLVDAVCGLALAVEKLLTSAQQIHIVVLACVYLLRSNEAVNNFCKQVSRDISNAHEREQGFATSSTAFECTLERRSEWQELVLVEIAELSCEKESVLERMAKAIAQKVRSPQSPLLRQAEEMARSASGGTTDATSTAINADTSPVGINPPAGTDTALPSSSRPAATARKKRGRE